MAPAALGEVSSAVNTNGPDGAVVEETHLKDRGVAVNALPDEPDKENVFERHGDAGISSQSTVPDDLFDDDSEEDCDDIDVFVPRGRNDNPTQAKAGPRAVPMRKPKDGDAGTNQFGKDLGAEETTGKSKDVNAHKKEAKAPK